MTRIRDTWADSDAPITLELYYSGDWQDITEHLGEDGVQITRGRADWASNADPAEMSCTLDNTGGRYSPRNPNSPLYELIGRNTPIRVSVTINSVTYVRFYGEVVSWPQEWTKKGTPYTPIQCAGVSRRLAQGKSPLKSAYYRGCTSTVAPVTSLISYWPLEDEKRSTLISSGLPSGRKLDIVGTPSLAEDSDSFPCSDPLVVMTSGSAIAGSVDAHTYTGDYQIWFLLKIPSGGVTGRIALIATQGSASRWNLGVDTSGNLTVTVTDDLGSTLDSYGPSAFAVNGKELRVTLSMTQNGADIDWALSTLEVGQISGLTSTTQTTAGETLGNLWGVALAPDKTMTGVTYGHVTVQTDVTSIFALSDLLNSYRGEAAATRVDRLCTEEGVTATIVGTAADSAWMGFQQSNTLMDLLFECQNTDLGALHEPKDSAGLEYRTRESICAQTAGITIPYTDNLLLPFKPIDDDQLTRNKVTVTRAGGNRSTVEVTTGPMSTQDPPNGVGMYDAAVTISMAYDDHVNDQATWRTHVGTINEARWPKIGIELAHPTFRDSTALTAAVLGLDIGDRIVITDVPDWLPPFNVDQVITGYSEEINPSRYKIILNCVPYAPYRVGVYDTDDDSLYSGEGTVLAENLDTTETEVDITAPDDVEWTHDDGDYDVITGGEIMTVTGIAGAAPDYTFTVTRSVNGVIKSHSAGAEIDLAYPVYYGL